MTTEFPPTSSLTWRSPFRCRAGRTQNTSAASSGTCNKTVRPRVNHAIALTPPGVSADQYLLITLNQHAEISGDSVLQQVVRKKMVAKDLHFNEEDVSEIR